MAPLIIRPKAATPTVTASTISKLRALLTHKSRRIFVVRIFMDRLLEVVGATAFSAAPGLRRFSAARLLRQLWRGGVQKSRPSAQIPPPRIRRPAPARRG